MNASTFNSTALNSENEKQSTPVIGDFNCTVTTSSYKWLSSTLLTAQQQYATQPTFIAEVQNNNFYPRSNSTTSNGVPVNKGDAVTAPDGNILVAGEDAGGNLAFWKIADLDPGQSSPWGTSTTLLANGSWNPNYNVAIAVSDYIAGTYVIDVYYFVGTGSGMYIAHQRSTNGGTTWKTADSATGDVFNGLPFIWLAAGKPVLQTTTGNVDGIVFYLQGDATAGDPSVIDYAYSANASLTSPTWSTQNQWSSNIDARDWSINSFDVLRTTDSEANDVFYVYFSGYHQTLEATNGMNSIYLSQFYINAVQGNYWSSEIILMPSLSSATQNQNNFIYPKIRYDGTKYWLVFFGTTVQSTSGATTTTNTNYFLSTSTDGKYFSYPTALFDSTGTNFTAATTTPLTYSLVNQLSVSSGYNNYFLIGSGYELVYAIPNAAQNNVCNISPDVLTYQITEGAAQPSVISMDVGNMNGQYLGPSPTKTGAAAIINNSKLCLYQGYYNAAGVMEYAPRNTFYIQDIQQFASASRSDFQLSGKDFNKQLALTVSRFAQTFTGPSFYYDPFDGSTIGNWSQNLGTWQESLITAPDSTTFNAIYPSSVTNSDMVITLQGYNITKAVSIIGVTALIPTISGSELYVYPYYQDANNWLRLRITTTGGGTWNWYVELSSNVSGSQIITTVTSGSGSYGGAGAQPYYPIYIKRYNFLTFDFFLGNNLGDGNSNSSYGYYPLALGVQIFNPSYLQTNVVTTVGLGCNGYAAQFSNFRFVQNNQSSSIQDLCKRLGNIAGITQYKFKNLFEEYVFSSSDWTGTFTAQNREIALTAGNAALFNVSQITAGEVEFDAQATPTANGNYGFDILAYSQALSYGNGYMMRVEQRADNNGNPLVSVSLRIKNSAATSPNLTEAVLYSTTYDSYNTNPGTPPPPQGNPLPLNIAEYHKYKITMAGGWISLYIDNELYLSYYDTNTGGTYSSGYFGVHALTNSQVLARNFVSTYFYYQVPSFGINPGDDMQSDVTNLLQQIMGWFYSDLFGRFYGTVLEPTDQPNYTYSELLNSQLTDTSDQEVVNQVTIIGNGVSYMLSSTPSQGTTVVTREAVIENYQITTVAQAKAAAQFQLTNFNKLNSQSEPVQTNNVGSEIFDVVTVDFTDTNTNANQRIYNQTITMDGQSTQYTIQIGSGQVT